MPTRQSGTELAGENALERFDSSAFGQVVATNRSDLTAFTYPRMNKRLFESENWQQLVEFVKNMKEGGDGRRRQLSEEVTTGNDLYVGFVRRSRISEKVEDASLV